MTRILKLSPILLLLASGAAAPEANAQQSQDTNNVQFATPSGHIIPIGGPKEPAHFRPPLWQNTAPSSSTYYTPVQLRHAYGFDKLNLTGAGQTIAIVDAYGSSSIQNDLNTFCSKYGLQTTSVAIKYPQGKPGMVNTSWAQETSLDVEWAHAVAPGATIVLVVTKTSNFSDMLGGVDYAVNTLGAKIVSMSWGGSEFSSETGSSYDGHFKNPAVTFVASSGDSGAGCEWPAASPYVLSVGGTSLYLDSSNNRTSESAWSSSGGGLSGYEVIPSYQTAWLNTGTRGVPDVSYVADPNTGMAVIYKGNLMVFGGTSAGAPQWAALVALANQLRASTSTSSLGAANDTVYKLAGDPITPTYFYDITSGSNGSGANDWAVAGYDLVTGLGSPVANTLVQALGGNPTPDFALTVAPSSFTVPSAGGTATYTVTLSRSGGLADTINLALTGAPAGSSVTFNPPSVDASTTSSTLTVTTGTLDATTANAYTLTVTGTSASNSSLQHSATASLLNFEDIFGNDSAGAEWAGNKPYEYGTRFTTTIGGTITKVRMICAPDETGTHQVRVWQVNADGTGTLLTPDPRTTAGAAYNWTTQTRRDWAWQEFTLPTRLSVTAGTYVVDVTTGSDATANVAYASGYFNAAGSNGGHISWPAGAGVYTTTIGTMPTQPGGGNAAYMRDVEFLPASQ